MNNREPDGSNVGSRHDLSSSKAESSHAHPSREGDDKQTSEDLVQTIIDQLDARDTRLLAISLLHQEKTKQLDKKARIAIELERYGSLLGDGDGENGLSRSVKEIDDRIELLDKELSRNSQERLNLTRSFAFRIAALQAPIQERRNSTENSVESDFSKSDLTTGQDQAQRLSEIVRDQIPRSSEIIQAKTDIQRLKQEWSQVADMKNAQAVFQQKEDELTFAGKELAKKQDSLLRRVEGIMEKLGGMEQHMKYINKIVGGLDGRMNMVEFQLPFAQMNELPQRQKNAPIDDQQDCTDLRSPLDDDVHHNLGDKDPAKIAGNTSSGVHSSVNETHKRRSVGAGMGKSILSKDTAGTKDVGQSKKRRREEE